MKVCWLLLVAVILSSCSKHYLDAIDEGSNEPVKSNFFEIYSDYNIFRYQNNIAFTRDNEKFFPRSFEIKLPKGLVYYEINNSTDFGFYYDHDQIVFIKVKLENAISKADSAYTPTRDELVKLIDQKLSTSGNKKYDLKQMKLLSERRNYIIDKGDALILLYNIEHKAFDNFYKEIREFKFLD